MGHESGGVIQNNQGVLEDGGTTLRMHCESSLREAKTIHELLEIVKKAGGVRTVEGEMSAEEFERALNALLAHRNSERLKELGEDDTSISLGNSFLFFHNIKPAWLREKVKNLLTSGEDVRDMFERASSIAEIKILLEQSEAISDEKTGECKNAHDIVRAFNALLAFREKKSAVLRGELQEHELVGSELLYLQAIKPWWLREKIADLLAFEDSLLETTASSPAIDQESTPAEMRDTEEEMVPIPTALYSNEENAFESAKEDMPDVYLASAHAIQRAEDGYTRAVTAYEHALKNTNSLTRMFSPSFREKEREMQNARMYLAIAKSIHLPPRVDADPAVPSKGAGLFGNQMETLLETESENASLSEKEPHTNTDLTQVSSLESARSMYMQANTAYEQALKDSNPFTRMFSPSLREKEREMWKATMRMKIAESIYLPARSDAPPAVPEQGSGRFAKYTSSLPHAEEEISDNAPNEMPPRQDIHLSAVHALGNAQNKYEQAVSTYERALKDTSTLARIFSPSFREKERNMRSALAQLRDVENTYYTRE